MGAGKRYDLTAEHHAMLRGLPWSFPRFRITHNKVPANLTGYQFRLRVIDPTAPAGQVIEVQATAPGADGWVDGMLLTAEQVSALSNAPTYVVLMTDSLANTRPYLRGLLKVVG